MYPRQASPVVLLILLCVAAFPTTLSLAMLAPLLVDLAVEPGAIKHEPHHDYTPYAQRLRLAKRLKTRMDFCYD